MGRIKPIKAASAKGGGGRIRGATAARRPAATPALKRARTASKVVGGLKVAGRAGRLVPGVGQAIAVGELAAPLARRAGGAIAGRFRRGSKVSPEGFPIKRRRRLVPKRVQKWIRKTVARRKAETKALRKIVSASGLGVKARFGRKK